VNFNEETDDGMAEASAGQYANHLHLTDNRQITMPAPHHSIFYRLDALPDVQPTVSKLGRQFNQSLNQSSFISDNNVV